MSEVEATRLEIEAAHWAVRAALEVLKNSRANIRDGKAFVCVAIDDVLVVTSSLEAADSLCEEILNAHYPAPW